MQASLLSDELVRLGYPRSYRTFTRMIRDRGAAAGLSGVRGGGLAGHDRGRPSAWVRDQVGLGGAAVHAVACGGS